MRMPYGMDLDTFKHLESTGELNTVLQLLQNSKIELAIMYARRNKE